MSRWADWIAISQGQADAFLGALRFGDKGIAKLLLPLLEEVQQSPQGCLHIQMDKAWEPIHRCLTDDRSNGLDFQAGDFPLRFCVLGGAPLLYEHRYRTASLTLPDEVHAVSSALRSIDRIILHDKFFLLPEYFHEINEEVFEWVWANFELLPPFFASAAKEQLAVICTISH